MGATMGTLVGRPEPPDRFINRMISEHCVVVFAKTHCPYSQMAKDIFKLLQVPIKAIDIDLRSDGDSIQETLKTMTRVRTVPRVFINGKCIGGGTETQRLMETGELINLVRRCMPDAGYCECGKSKF